MKSSGFCVDDLLGKKIPEGSDFRVWGGRLKGYSLGSFLGDRNFRRQVLVFAHSVNPQYDLASRVFIERASELASVKTSVAMVSTRIRHPLKNGSDGEDFIFPVFDDPGRVLGGVLGIPSSPSGNWDLYEPVWLVLHNGVIEKVFGPVDVPGKWFDRLMEHIRSIGAPALK
ncbi:MAG: hypothetical protein PHV42_01860 [Candidatus Pacebacteria bacterium]|nr:hypothetical protein [Candidatus Paceibacterota bacterium]